MLEPAAAALGQHVLEERPSNVSDPTSEVALEFSAALGVEFGDLRSRMQEQQKQQEEVMKTLQAQLQRLEHHVSVSPPTAVAHWEPERKCTDPLAVSQPVHLHGTAGSFTCPVEEHLRRGSQRANHYHQKTASARSGTTAVAGSPHGMPDFVSSMPQRQPRRSLSPPLAPSAAPWPQASAQNRSPRSVLPPSNRSSR